MANKFVDQNGLRYFFSKLKRMFEGKADKDSLKPVATSGKYSDLEDKPTSLPANGGNADTVDNKHASDFAAANHNHALSQLTDDTTHRTVTDTEKTTWNAKTDIAAVDNAISSFFSGKTVVFSNSAPATGTSDNIITFVKRSG